MNIPELYASEVFNEETMKQMLTESTYSSLLKTIEEGSALDDKIAQEVANAMKDWAISKGATHYTHWFQPMTGITAEKHDSFIAPNGQGSVIMDFSAKELIRGEPDASSFPSGGIRASFEARGYTAWDPTSFAFIKDKTLCIPTAFCAYSGEALDKKTPLLRSCDVLSKKVVKMLHLLGDNDVKSVQVNVGSEQEYFLIDKATAYKRMDLVLTGRTLFGAKPSKGQELEDHYYGAIKPRVKAFMEELDIELWKLGIQAKTEHNEVAPSQHELAPVYCSVNIATDNNQLTMEFMKKIAEKHGLLCLLNEKPFAGINGSGKHNNWSISTNTGVNLLKPGKTPMTNYKFLLIIAAMIQAADKYQDLFRYSITSAGNDNRLGGFEAPPAILSIYLGDDLYKMLSAIASHSSFELQKSQMGLGTTILPTLLKDTTDRNRTSPLAFTGNKFEFRMVGSNDSIADCNTVINTALSEAISEFIPILENSSDIKEAVHKIVSDTFKKHGRILFNGNNYTSEWVDEAKNRGLLNLKSTPEAISTITDLKNINLFTSLNVFTETEIRARQQISYENYSRTIHIEAMTSTEMAKKSIYPAINSYIRELLQTVKLKEEVGIKALPEINLAKKLSSLNDRIYSKTKEIEKLLSQAESLSSPSDIAYFFHDKVLQSMHLLRQYADDAESLTAKEYWPFPTYEELLYIQ